MLGFSKGQDESGIHAGMTIDVDQIIARLEWAAARGLSTFAVATDTFRLSLVRGTGEDAINAAPCATQEILLASHQGVSAPKASTIDAPLAGLCQLASAPGAAPFAEPGMTVAAGQTLCLIEAMKVMTSVTAADAGVIDAVLVGDGTMVEAGTPLFRMRA
jgi:acetyl-CoA carboxylase biotin carboxyl carrier protein